jgi:hypothetical protein
MYTSETDFTHVIKSSQPPIIERPLSDRQHHPSNLTRTRILRTNESGIQSFDDYPRHEPIVVRPPTVQTRDILIGRARRTLTDDGSADVVHHVGIVSPPPAYSIVKRLSTQIRATITTSTTDQYELPQVITVPPPDFVDRSQIYIRQQRIQSHIAQPHSDDLIDGALSSSQQVLIKDDDYDPSLRIPVQVKNENLFFTFMISYDIVFIF